MYCDYCNKQIKGDDVRIYLFSKGDENEKGKITYCHECTKRLFGVLEFNTHDHHDCSICGQQICSIEKEIYFAKYDDVTFRGWVTYCQPCFHDATGNYFKENPSL